MVAVIGFTACGNNGSQTGTTDTSFSIGTNQTTGEVDTGINGTNGNVPNTPDTTNTIITSPNQNDTLNKKRMRQ